MRGLCKVQEIGPTRRESHDDLQVPKRLAWGRRVRSVAYGRLGMDDRLMATSTKSTVQDNAAGRS